jgi:Zn-dependent protease/predicted transcriptional regulator
MSSIPFGRVAGLAIRVHASWAIVVALIVVTVAAQMGSFDPATPVALRWGIGVAVAIGFLLSAVVHEVAHAVVARRRGVAVETVVVYFLGAAATTQLDTVRPRDEIATALAGPLASIGLGLGLLGVALVGDAVGSEAGVVVGGIALVVGTLDVALGALNLVPAYPLDGGRVVRAIAWSRTGDPRVGLRVAGTVGRVVGLVIAALGVLAIVVLEPVNGFMVALGGWFIVSTARSMERRAELDAILDGLLVRDVMDRDVTAIAPGLTIDTFANQVLGGSAAPALPVVRGTELLGVIGARQLRRVRRDRWATVRVQDVMVAPPTMPTVGPETSLQAALDGLARSSLDGLPVMEDGRLTGIILRRAVAEAVRLRLTNTGVAP